MASSAACECGADEQTVDHVVLQCPVHRPRHYCTGWQVWTMRQLNGCSTPAPRVQPSSGQDLAQTMKKIMQKVFPVQP